MVIRHGQPSIQPFTIHTERVDHGQQAPTQTPLDDLVHQRKRIVAGPKIMLVFANDAP